MDPGRLPLRDIHLPAPVSWWPLAVGWWGLLGLAMLVAVALILWWRQRRTRHARRAALAELGVIESALATQPDGHACAQALSRLLRRLALLVGGPAAATGSGAALFETLSALRAGPLPSELQALLSSAPYSPAAAAAIPTERYRDATAALRPWLKRLRLPRQKVTAAAHAAV